jgi:hypothetical protein
MIKAYMQMTYPAKSRPEEYKGLTSLSVNVGPADLEQIIQATTAALIDFWLTTHDEEGASVDRKVKRALNFMTANLVIQEAIR